MTRALLVFAGFVIAGAVSFAQVGGRGRNVAFVDGTTISPTSVQASGTADQFVCTATTAVCEVETATNATTMTATVPAFDIGPTATPDANDRLACFSYGATGSKTRAVCVDKEGDTSATGAFNSSVASGNQAYTCTNTGCRLSLGNTARYFVDDGTNLEAVAPMQATTFNATDATNASALFSGGSATNAMYFQSNTTDAFTAAATGYDSAFVFKLNENIGDNDIGFSVIASNNSLPFYLQENGQATFAGAVRSGTAVFQANGSTSVFLQGSPADGASAVATVLRSTTNHATSGAKLVSVRNNTTSEVSFIDYLGNLSGNSYAATATSGSSFTGGNSSTSLTMTSNATDSVTSGSVPAIRLKAGVDIASADLALAVERHDGAIAFSIQEDGQITFGASTQILNVGYFMQSAAAITIADNGGGTAAAYTWQPSYGRALTHFTCNDANGCDITLSETNIGSGVHHRAINVSANNITFTDTAGVTEMAGNFTAGQWDTIEFVYVTDRFVEIGRSNN